MIKRHYLNRDLESLRNILIYGLWESKKGQIIMKEVADIFNINLQTCYRIILKETKKCGK